MELARIASHQCGVVSRRQVLASGGDDNLIERMLRRRLWASVFPGVYVDHTGPTTWQQRAWAAVLYAAPAALTGTSALRAHGLGAYGDTTIRVAVDHRRQVRRREWIRPERVVDFDRVAQLHLSPPRVRIEHALLRVAAESPTDDGAVAVLADGVQAGRTTADRLGEELEHLPKIQRRGLLREVVQDVASGALSAMERRYLRDVERAHGLPHGKRQVADRIDGRVFRRDIEYRAVKIVVELDGRLGHEWAAERWNDLDRDILAATTGRLTLRAGWRQVLQPCRFALAIVDILRARGWRGTPRPCGPGCPVA